MIEDLGPDTVIADVVRRGRAHGQEVYVVPAGADKAESLAWFADELHLPNWFGHNLDALADSLHDLADSDPPAERTGRLLVWDGVVRLRHNDPAGYDGIRDVLADVEADHGRLEVVVVQR